MPEADKLGQDNDPGAGETVPAAPVSTARLVIGALALKAGTEFLARTIDRQVFGQTTAGSSQSKTPNAPGKIRGFASKRLAGIAAKSVPGALAVSGGLLVKYLFDRGGERMQAKRAAKKKSR